jgi:hypothetical protein
MEALKPELTKQAEYEKKLGVLLQISELRG